MFLFREKRLIACNLSQFYALSGFLGTDTAGSVRVPAAFCGILGFRPSHGAVPVIGVIPMAQSFDTVGKHSVTSSIYSGPCDGLSGSL